MPIYKVKNIKKGGLQKYLVRVNYFDNSGNSRQLTRTAYGVDNAKNLERELQFDIQTKGANSVKKMTVKQLYDEYVAAKKYEVRESTLDKTIRILSWYVLPLMENVDINKLSPKILQEWKVHIEGRRLSLTTRRNVFGEFRALCSYAVRMEYIPKNPLKIVGNFKDSMAMEREIKFYTPEEFKKFINVAKEVAVQKETQENNLYEWNYYVFFNIAFYTGLRKGEIHALRWTDIDGSYLSVKRSLTQKLQHRDLETPPKNKSSIRTLQLPIPLIKILEEHRERQERLSNYSEDRHILGDVRSVRDTSLQNKSRQYSSLAGVKRIRIHDFRHSHASLLVNMGINIQEVARRLGHAKIEMTWNTYSHLYPKEEEKAMAVLNSV